MKFVQTRIIFICILFCYLIVSLFLIWRMTTLQPYSDMLDWLSRYLDFQNDGKLTKYLLEPHNFHRIAWTLGAIAIDVKQFGAHGYTLVSLNSACLAAVCVMLAWIAVRGVVKEQRVFIGGVAVMLSLMAANLLDASIPINGVYAQCLAFSLAAILLGEHRDSEDGPGWAAGAGALAMVACATLGSAVGFVALPVLLVGAWQRRARRIWIATILIAGSCYAGLYAYGNALPHAASSGGPNIIQAIVFGLSYLGLPWTRVSPALGLITGGTVLALAVVALFLHGRRGTTAPHRLSTQLIVFTLGTVILAMIARTDTEAPTNVPVRYSIFLAPLHVGLLMLLWDAFGKAETRFPRGAAIAVIFAAATMLGQQVAMGYVLVSVTDKNRNLIADFRSGKRDPSMSPTVHWNLEHAANIRARLDQKGLYLREIHLAKSQRNSDHRGITSQ